MSYHIITPIGTSLLRNFSFNNTDFNLIELRGKTADDKKVEEYFKTYNKDVIQYMSSKDEDQSSCAETRSIESFLNEYEQNELDGITMLPTDTAESYLAYMFLEKYMKSKGYKIHCRVIKKLSYSDPKSFQTKGLKNLLEQLKLSIIQIRKDKVIPIINATAGFKAESAMVLLMAQFLKVDVFYIHELMKDHTVVFPNLPVEIEKSFWDDWKPVIKAVLDADRSDSGVLDISEFNEMIKYLDLNKAEFLFEINEEFGGVSLSVLGFLIAEGFDLELEEIKLKDSGISQVDRLDLNEREMHHISRGGKQCMEKIAELDFVKKVKNIKLENTAESRIKVKYDGRDPGEVQLTHSDGSVGLGIVVKTTASDQAENMQAKALIAKHVNISIGEEDDENKHLLQPGQLLKRSLGEEIISISELIQKAEDVIAAGDKLTKPYEAEIEKQRKKGREKDAEITNLNREIQKLRSQNQKLAQKLSNNQSDQSDGGMVKQSDLDRLSNKFSKGIK